MPKDKKTKDKKAASKSISKQAEYGSRRTLIEELFYDFNRKKTDIYWLNFVRGIFFGLGSVIGGTILIAVALTVLNLLVDLPGGIGEFVKSIIDVVQGSQNSR